MKLPQLTFGKVLAGTAVVLLLTTGTAYAANTVGSSDIINGEVKTADLANNAVTGGKIASNAVGSSDIANNAIKTADILDGTITGADVADNSIAAADIAAGGVGAEEIATNAVGATEIAENVIDSGEVVDFGLSNQDVGVLFAQVNADGSLHSSSGSVSALRIGPGGYEVDFDRAIHACAFTASVGPAGAHTVPAGFAGVADRNDNDQAVYVATRNADGVQADRPFHLIVVC